MKKELENLSEDNPFKDALESGMDSIETFEEQKEGLRADTDGYFKILSPKYHSGQIDANTLSDTVDGLQKIIYNIADLKYGKASKRGKISETIKADFDLIITGTKAGSFIIEIGDPDKQLNLFRDAGPIDILTETFSTIYTHPSPKKILTQYNLRTYNSLKSFFKNLNKNQSEFEIYNGRNQERIFFDEKNIQLNTENFKADIKEEEEKRQPLEGVLKRVDVANQTLSIENDNSELMTINVDDERFKDVELTTNKNYNFSVMQITYNIEGNENEKNIS